MRRKASLLALGALALGVAFWLFRPAPPLIRMKEPSGAKAMPIASIPAPERGIPQAKAEAVKGS